MGGGTERGARHVKFKEWNVAPPCPDGRRALEESGLSPLLAAVLSARGGPPVSTLRAMDWL